MVSVFYFTPLPGFFSPFPHGTCSLSVTSEYLALRDGPRCFQQGSSCLAVLRIPSWVLTISITGLSPSLVYFPKYFIYTKTFSSFSRSFYPSFLVWASPLSLATTQGIDFSFFSSGYLDVSVLQVTLSVTIDSLQDTNALPLVGSPIRKSPDRSILTAPRSISLFVTSFFSF